MLHDQALSVKCAAPCMHCQPLQRIEKPCDLWRSGRIDCRRAAVKLVFGERLQYCRNDGYRTAETSMPIKVFGDLTTQGSNMVRAAGLEPAREKPPNGF